MCTSFEGALKVFDVCVETRSAPTQVPTLLKNFRVSELFGQIFRGDQTRREAIAFYKAHTAVPDGCGGARTFDPGVC